MRTYLKQPVFVAPGKFEIGNEFYRTIIDLEIMKEGVNNNGYFDFRVTCQILQGKYF